MSYPELAPLFPPVWWEPAARPRLLREGGVEGALLGYQVYLVHVERKAQATALSYATAVRDFLAYLKARGRPPWPRMPTLPLPERGDLVRYLDEEMSRGHEQVAPRVMAALGAFARFLQWCGLEPFTLDWPSRDIYRRRRMEPLEPDLFEYYLRELRSYRARTAPLLRAVYVLMGVGGYRVRDLPLLTLAHLAKPRLRLPGGYLHLEARYWEDLEAYLDWRSRILPYPTDRLLFTPKGKALTFPALRSAHIYFLRALGEEPPFPLYRLTLLGGRRLAERYGLLEARRLLKRVVVF